MKVVRQAVFDNPAHCQHLLHYGGECCDLNPKQGHFQILDTFYASDNQVRKMAQERIDGSRARERIMAALYYATVGALREMQSERILFKRPVMPSFDVAYVMEQVSIHGAYKHKKDFQIIEVSTSECSVLLDHGNIKYV